MSEEFLLHTTSTDILERLANDGFTGISYWARPGAVSDYYAETVQDEDKQPATVRLPLSVLAAFGPEPDRPGLEEPLTHPLNMTEEEVWEQWEETGQTWQECLELIESIRVRQPIPAAIVLEHNPLLAGLIRPDASRPRAKM